MNRSGNHGMETVITCPPLDTSQVFDEVKPLVVSCMDGYHVCIFAYGQTGSGKTFTMEVSNCLLFLSKSVHTNM